jgi:hypothetical protein
MKEDEGRRRKDGSKEQGKQGRRGRKGGGAEGGAGRKEGGAFFSRRLRPICAGDMPL